MTEFEERLLWYDNEVRYTHTLFEHAIEAGRLLNQES